MSVWSGVNQRRVLLADAWRTRLWPVPTVGILLAIASGVALTRLDRAIDDVLPPAVTEVLFGGGPAAAREVLGAVATALITVTSLTFSLTLVTLQLASSQFSPRLLRTFARDRFVQRTLALFLATFTYALTVLRTVRDDPEFVPRIAVTIGFLLTLLSVVALVLFLAHLVREIRVETMLRSVYADGLQSACELLPLEDDGDRHDGAAPHPSVRSIDIPGDASVVPVAASGFLVHLDEDALLAAAVEHNAVIAVTRPPGAWLVAGTPVGWVWPDRGGADFDPDQLATLCNRVVGAIHTGDERTTVQDAGYAIRQLTDVAVKALSPGINDPTTAVHALGHSSALLCTLAKRRLGPVLRSDEDGAPRVMLARPDFADLLDEALAQPRHYGAADAAVLRGILDLLGEVAWCAANTDQRAAIARQLALAKRNVAERDFDQERRDALMRACRSVESILDGRSPT
ncbi:DUF2254 domain-containing protein [Mycolicibacterium sp. XJ2546]